MLIRKHPFLEADKGDNINDSTHEKPPTTETEPPPEPSDVDEQCDQYIGELLNYIEQQRATIEQLTTRLDEHERVGHASPEPEPGTDPEPEPEESHWYFKRVGGKKG